MSFEEGRQYDIIFAGGGTAACVAAGRLAAADPTLSILLIERGKNNLNNPMIRSPGIYFANLAPSSTNAIFYQAESEPSLNNIARTISTGGVLGGGSSINAMMYTRAQARDYDSFGVEGWDWKSLLPYARKLETIAVPEVSSLDQSVHGTTGPIEISYGTHCPKGPQDDILAAAKSYGYPEIHDLQDFTSVGGFNRSAKYIGRDGTRQDAAHRYIHPLIADGKHPNLHILPESKVRRVLFEGSRAVGVEYEPEPMFLLQDISLITRISKTVKAKKLIVVSAGALGTPLILERSGIGNKELLAKHNIPLISDLPSVGENYQDHHFLLCPYKTNLSPDETLDGIMTRRRDFMEALTSKDTILGTNALDIGAKLRMTAEEVDALGPEFKAIWDRDFKDDSTKPIMLMGTLNFFVGDHKMLNEEKNGVHQYITMASYTPYPYSRGSIHITSPDCNVPPKFITGYLGDTNGIDLKKSVWAYKKARDIYRRTNAFAGEVALGHPVFRDGSPAALSIGPIKKAEFHSVEERKDIPPVEYDEEDNRAIEKFIRDKISTTWHSLGTCKMAPRDRGGVVDKDLNVYGLTGLKCADMSIVPENVAANTNNTALIVGEKAADIIGKELGLVV